MRFIKVIAVILAFGIIFAGCNMVEVNEERDREVVAAKVNDEIITKGEVLDSVESQLQMYIAYGLYPEDFATNPDYEEYYTEVINGTLDAFVDSKVEEITAQQRGCYEFTAEERAAMDEDINTTLDTYAEMYATVLSADEAYAEMTEEEIKEYALANLDVFFEENEYGITKQDIIDNVEDTEALDNLFEMTTSSVEVTEDEVKAQYDTYVEESKAAYEDGTANVEDDAANGETIYYMPENVRMAQHILIMIPQEVQDNIAALRTAEDDDVANLMYQNALADIYDAAYAAYGRAVAGEDFELLIEELGEDSGMETNDYYVVSYPTQNYVEEFAEGLFALENVGDISEPIATEYGYHIIKYYGDMESGPIAYDDVRDGIYEEMLSERKQAYYDEQFLIWEEGMDIKTYYKRLTD